MEFVLIACALLALLIFAYTYYHIGRVKHPVHMDCIPPAIVIELEREKEQAEAIRHRQGADV
ncbi:hypothetical protein [Salinimonas chungwhensis]|uniref:hypothetical protein n=1 Tax=Salinimonas chungwhensis TaxID=265425 RepID=UPI0003793ED5|nr:hypothetical protein [Salinimonas chungwhensis]